MLPDRTYLAPGSKMLAALKEAESFVSGFEDDETQDGIDVLLADIRSAITAGEKLLEPLTT